MNHSSGAVIEQVPADQLSIAMSFMADHVPTGLDAESSARFSSDPTPVLFWARRDREILGVGRVPHPVGGLVHLSPPIVRNAASSVLHAMLAAFLASLQSQPDAQVAQAISPTKPSEWSDALEKLSFRQIATIDVMGALPDSGPRESGLEFRQASAADHSRLGEIVSATWEGSRDCIGLDDPRSVSDVLQEYAARCSGDDRHWYIVRERGRDAGCLIMDRTRDATSLDIVYWGIIPAERGRRLGDRMLRSARQVAAAEGRVLTSLVDRANFPAIRAYSAGGFSVLGSERLFVLRIR